MSESNKTELFNGWIKYKGNYQYLKALDRSELEKIFEAIRNGEPTVRVAGRKLAIADFDSFKIYDVAKANNKCNKGHLIHELDIQVRLFNPIRAIKNSGYDRTGDFDIPEPGTEVSTVTKPVVKRKASSGNKIFVSHSSKDQEIVSQFVDKVLILGMGVDQDNIFFTSGIGTGIKTGEDFKQRIESEMQGARAVFQILSPNYKKSEVCLNEMGAAWAISEIVIPVLGPPYDYDTGFLHASNQQLKLNDKDALMSLFDDYKESIFNPDQKIARLSKSIDDFVTWLERNKSDT